ncbi:sulfotransferase [Dongia deserti]|uniref:sulfotransferase n=1 Tax=Dongia deserti TaxID=2268030 RepID=UPI0038995650
MGLGPCHHMEEVLHDMSVQVPLWIAAAKGHPDWDTIYKGYESAVDWPTAGFYRELSAAYPSAKFILTHRSAESWAQSFFGDDLQIDGPKGWGSHGNAGLAGDGGQRSCKDGISWRSRCGRSDAGVCCPQ